MAINIEDLVSQIKAELVQIAGKDAQWHQDETTGYQWLVVRKGGVQRWIPTGNVRQIASSFFKQLKKQGILEIDEVLVICEKLLQQRVAEYRTIAFQWSFQLKKQYMPRHFTLFERWAHTYITGWGSCDNFCTHSMGVFIYQYPQFIPRVKKWVKSVNPFVRRAAAVTFIYSLRRGKAFDHIFEVADFLLSDPNIYVRKGYGWMLKEASKHFQQEIFEYVMQKKAVMPRVALRYAIEKMPQSLRHKAMEGK